MEKFGEFFTNNMHRIAKYAGTTWKENPPGPAKAFRVAYKEIRYKIYEVRYRTYLPLPLPLPGAPAR